MIDHAIEGVVGFLRDHPVVNVAVFIFTVVVIPILLAFLR